MTDTTGSTEEPGKPVDGGNVKPLFQPEDPDFIQRLVDGAAKIAEIAGQRKELNAEIAAVMANFENEGLNRHAAKAAMRYVEMNEKEQQNYDLTYSVMRKALGQPLQDDLLVAAARRDIENHAKGKH